MHPQIYPLDELALKAEIWRQNSNKLVLATGVFDLLHQEHRKFLAAAAQKGGKLMVGIETDARVRQLKGEGRPIDPQLTRATNVAQLPVVDAAFVLPEQFDRPEDHRRLLEQLRPAVLAVSSHSHHQDKKAALIKQVGGELCVVLPYNPAISTTQLLQEQNRTTES